MTPNHFLIGQLGGEFAPDCEHHSNHPLKRWKRVQEILQHFWARWVREIIPNLNPRSKWRTLQRNIRLEDIVWVLTLETERGKWPLGKVVEVHEGIDGNVRSVKVLVDGKVWERGLSSLSLLVPSHEI